MGFKLASLPILVVLLSLMASTAFSQLTLEIPICRKRCEGEEGSLQVRLCLQRCQMLLEEDHHQAQRHLLEDADETRLEKECLEQCEQRGGGSDECARRCPHHLQQDDGETTLKRPCCQQYGRAMKA